jgi:hypothetical protein
LDKIEFSIANLGWAFEVAVENRNPFFCDIISFDDEILPRYGQTPKHHGDYAFHFHYQRRHEMPAIWLQSFNFQDRFIRHQNFLGELTPIMSELDRNDATFSIGSGTLGSIENIRSSNFPSRVLRHQDFRIKLDEFNGLTPVEDASFKLVPGLADPAGISFASVNFPDRFIRHRDFHLFLEPADSDLARSDATFFRASPVPAITLLAVENGGRFIEVAGTRFTPTQRVTLDYDITSGGVPTFNQFGEDTVTSDPTGAFIHPIQVKGDISGAQVKATDVASGMTATASI